MWWCAVESVLLEKHADGRPPALPVITVVLRDIDQFVRRAFQAVVRSDASRQASACKAMMSEVREPDISSNRS